MNITEVCIRRPVLAWMLMAATIVFGIVAGRRIGISQFPDVDYPNITVSVSWPGASPEAVERMLVEPLEQALAQVEGISGITASARSGSARITVSFDISRNIDLALQDTQAKVAQAQRQLPKDVEPPVISKSNPDDQPIITLGLSGPFARSMLSDVARYQVQQKLQTVPGVGQVQLNGYRERAIRVWLDADKLTELAVTVSEVQAALQKEHVETPGGSLLAPGRQTSVKVLGEAADLGTLRKLPIKMVGTTPIQLEDVAIIEDGFEDANSFARADGAPLQTVGILKQRGTNAVAVATDIRAAVADLEKTLPKGMKLEVLNDTTLLIEQSVHHIEVELIIAVLLTALVCWMFLGSLSSTMNVILAIPMSLLGTVAIIYFWGFTLNTFTLLGLSLAIGLVVDDAVMVMENIYRHAEMGKNRVLASLEGTQEITFAALAATLAVMAIFLPVVFMDGVIGRFFFQFGVTLSVAVAFSYVEAITLAPARCAQLLKAGHTERGYVGRLVDRAFARLERAYAAVLALALRVPVLVLAVTAVFLAVSAWAYTKIPSELVPTQDQSRLLVRLTGEVGTEIDETDRLVRKAEEILARRPEIEKRITNVSAGSGMVTLVLVPPSQRKLSQAALQAELRRDLSRIPGLRATITDPSQSSVLGRGGGGGGGRAVELSVRGADWDTLVGLALGAKERLQKSGFLVDVDTDYQVGLPEVQITPDRDRAMALGVSMRDIGTTVNSLIGGVNVGKYSSLGRRIDVRMRTLKSQRSRPEDIDRMRVRSAGGDLIPIATLVTRQEKPVLQAINHVDRERAITVSANLAPGRAQSEALALVEELAREMPPGYRIVTGGQTQQFQASMSSLMFALALGIVVAYMILAAQFNSYLHPVTVLSILPLSVAGAAFALLATGKTLNIFSMIGLLLLMGIVKKNSIILVDYTNQVRQEEALPTKEALQRAGPVRLRPILMTSIATLMGAVPAALELGQGAETRSPMAIAVIGGVTLSTILSLIVVPAFYLVADRIRSRVIKPERSEDIVAPAHPV